MYLYIQIEESPSINFCLQVDGLPTRLGTSEEVGRRQPESDLQDLLGNNGCLNNMELGNSIGNLLVFFFACWCDQHMFLCMILCVWCTFGPGFAGFWAGILMFRSFSGGFGGSTCVGDSDWLYSSTCTCFNHQTRNQCVFCCSCHFLKSMCCIVLENQQTWVFDTVNKATARESHLIYCILGWAGLKTKAPP